MNSFGELVEVPPADASRVATSSLERDFCRRRQTRKKSARELPRSAVEGVTRLLRICLALVVTETFAGLAVLHREPVIANRADRKTKFGHFSSATSRIIPRKHPQSSIVPGTIQMQNDGLTSWCRIKF